jgi:hypothetical protein
VVREYSNSLKTWSWLPWNQSECYRDDRKDYKIFHIYKIWLWILANLYIIHSVLRMRLLHLVDYFLLIFTKNWKILSFFLKFHYLWTTQHHLSSILNGLIHLII